MISMVFFFFLISFGIDKKIINNIIAVTGLRKNKRFLKHSVHRGRVRVVDLVISSEKKCSRFVIWNYLEKKNCLLRNGISRVIFV